MTTAVAIFKGAFAAVVGIPLGRTTVGVNFPDSGRARLTIFCGNHAPPNENDMDAVLKLANQKIAEDISCMTIQLDRAQAVSRFGDLMFDKLEVLFSLSWYMNQTLSILILVKAGSSSYKYVGYDIH